MRRACVLGLFQALVRFAGATSWAGLGCASHQPGASTGPSERQGDRHCGPTPSSEQTLRLKPRHENRQHRNKRSGFADGGLLRTLKMTSGYEYLLILELPNCTQNPILVIILMFTIESSLGLSGLSNEVFSVGHLMTSPLQGKRWRRNGDVWASPILSLKDSTPLVGGRPTHQVKVPDASHISALRSTLLPGTSRPGERSNTQTASSHIHRLRYLPPAVRCLHNVIHDGFLQLERGERLVSVAIDAFIPLLALPQSTLTAGINSFPNVKNDTSNIPPALPLTRDGRPPIIITIIIVIITIAF